MDVNFQPSGVTNQGSFVPDNLVIGDFPSVTKAVTLKAGRNYKRGDVLMGLTAGDAGKFGIVTTDANAKYILLEDTDATSADKISVAAVTGKFNRNRVTLGAGATLAGVTAALEPLSVFLLDSVQ
jgi:hypothetical protein